MSFCGVLFIVGPSSAEIPGLVVNIGSREEQAAAEHKAGIVTSFGSAVGGKITSAAKMLEDPDRAAAEKARYTKLGQFAYEDGGYQEAAMHFSSALNLFPQVESHAKAHRIARSNEWKVDDQRRVEAAGLYANRSAAYVALLDSGHGPQALYDGLTAGL